MGIILVNDAKRVFWARRSGQAGWQFPQGGIRRREHTEDALYRELAEETGLRAQHVELIGCTRDWLYYRLPSRFIRRRAHPVCIGQKQRWFLLRLLADESCIDLAATAHPEFDDWCWVDYWRPPKEVVFFKRHVYRRALREFEPLLFPHHDDADAATAVRR